MSSGAPGSVAISAASRRAWCAGACAAITSSRSRGRRRSRHRLLLALGGDWEGNPAAVIRALSLARGIDPADTATTGALFP
jgi:hypothetical protein